MNVLKFKIRKPVSSLQTPSNDSDRFPEGNYEMTAISFLKTKDLIIPLAFCIKGPSLWANLGRDGCSLCPGREGFPQELMHYHRANLQHNPNRGWQLCVPGVRGSAGAGLQELCWVPAPALPWSCPAEPLCPTHTDTGAAARAGRSWFIACLGDFSFQPGLYRCKPSPDVV